MDRLRIGTLSAARITPEALIAPARELPETEVAAVSARDQAHAEAFAAENGIPVVHKSYEALLDDPDIDAVYNPLPNSLHALWTLRALRAGKHVLCEKPFASNGTEAREVADAAREAGLVVMEAMHYRYHPLAQAMTAQLPVIAGDQAAGGNGIRHIQCAVSFPLASLSDIRYSYELAGGATMDAGCYALDLVRLLGPGEPTVITAFATELGMYVDQAMSAFLRFPGGGTAWLDLSFGPSDGRFRADVHVIGAEGQMTVLNFIHPYRGYRMTTSTAHHTESVTADDGQAGETTYVGQLRAFAGAVLRGKPFPTTADQAVVTMDLIDEIYLAAGLPRRPSGQQG
jgi:predicted dehydrogenase